MEASWVLDATVRVLYFFTDKSVCLNENLKSGSKRGILLREKQWFFF